MTSRFQRSTALTALAVALLIGIRPAEAQEAPLDPESPLAELPDIGVEWPDLPAEEAGEPNAATATTEAGDRRYSVVLSGVPTAPANQVDERFAELSALKTADNKPANLAQLDRRARDDTALLEELLRADGYYDSNITPRIEAVGDRIVVTLTVEPGPLYSFDSITVTGLDENGALRQTFNIAPKDAVDADNVTRAETDLRLKLANEGFPFAKVEEPDVVIDHDTRTASLSMSVETGGKRSFGKIISAGEKQPFNAAHIADIARFKPGEDYNLADVDDLKRAIIATGLVSSVSVDTREGEAPGTVDMVVTTTPAPVRTVAAEAGYGTGEGFRLSASWTHRNLLRPEGAVTFAGVAGTLEQSLSATLRQANWQRRDWILNGRVAASNVQRAAYDARTFEIGANIERQTNIIWQKKWTWSAGFELLASEERDVVARGGARRTFFIGALPATLSYDGSNDLLDPTRGFRLSGRVIPETSLDGGAYAYVRSQVDGSLYFPVSDRVTLAGRARLGSITGASLTNIAPSRRFYSGGGGSVRGYGYQAIGPRDAFGDPVGGRSLAEFSIEARVRVGAFGVVPFVDAGNIYTSSTPSLDKLRLGAGIGGRYHSSFGPIRIDIGTPIKRRTGESRFAVYVSLGQAF